MTERIQIDDKQGAYADDGKFRLYGQPTRFIHRTLIVVGVVGLAVALGALLYYASNVLLLAFAGVLLGVVLDGLSQFISRHTPLPRSWALGLVVVALLALFVGAAWFIGPRIASQSDLISQQFPQSLDRFRQWLGQYGWGQALLAQLPDSNQLLQGSTQLLTRAGNFANALLTVSGGLIVILFVGIFVAASPDTYYKGLLQLVPPRRRDRAREVLSKLAPTLRWWVVGQLVSMSVIGVVSGVGLWLLGVPLALTLGLFAGLMEFIPNFGPWLGGIPAVLLALTQGTTTALWVVGLYVGLQFVEGYLILPLVQQRAVDVPPALTILAQVLLSVLFGFLGLLLAVPLVATTMVIVRMLYVEDVLEKQGGLNAQMAAQEEHHAA